MTLSKDKILKHAGVLPTRLVHVPAWVDENGDDTVLVRGMTVREFEVNQATLGKDEGTATAALVSRCIVDEGGMRVFDDANIPQIAELGFAQINVIGQAISELSGLSEPDKDDPGKASEPTSTGSSSSGSPENSEPQSTS